MRKQISLLFIMILVFLLSLCVGCSKTTQDISNTFSEELSYNNDDFGITIQIPDNWEVNNKETVGVLYKKGIKQINENIEKKSNVTSPVKLLMMSKNSMKTSDNHNVIFGSGAEKVRKDIKTAKDYLLLVKTQSEKGATKYTFEKEIYTEEINGIDFAVLECTFKNPHNIDIHQKFYVTIIKDYIYYFPISYVDLADMKIIDKIINSIKISK